MNIKDIVDSIQHSGIKITDHADEEAHSDELPFEEILLSVENGEIIERYIQDKPYPSCLIFGLSTENEPIHSVWAYNEDNKWSVLITVYRPDPKRWGDWKTRRT